MGSRRTDEHEASAAPVAAGLFLPFAECVEAVADSVAHALVSVSQRLLRERLFDPPLGPRVGGCESRCEEVSRQPAEVGHDGGGVGARRGLGVACGRAVGVDRRRRVPR